MKNADVHKFKVVEPSCSEITTARTWADLAGEVAPSHRRMA